ncbi:uncharacterized protein LOC142774180 [Rhipicephalus microplus]|uniref:uncharacterized protein LOC142774180 n=1 Tax=Rhipicephalus microplus TaxID=6941 RepID=UPI003F6BB376
MLALFDKASADAAHYEHLRSLVKLDGEVLDVTRIATDDEITLPLEQLDVEEIPHEMLASPVNRALPLDSEASSATEIVVNGIDRVCNAFSVVARTDSWVLSMYLPVLVTSQAIRYEFHERYAEVEQRVDWTYVACREILSRLFPGHYSTMEATALRENKHKKVPASELLEEAKAHLTVSLNDSVSIDDAAEDAMRQQLSDIDIMSVNAVKASDFLAESDEKYTQSYTKTCSSQHARAQWNTPRTSPDGHLSGARWPASSGAPLSDTSRATTPL